MRHLYSTFICTTVHPKHFYNHVKGSLLIHLHLDDATAARHSPHTSYRRREERQW